MIIMIITITHIISQDINADISFEARPPCH